MPTIESIVRHINHEFVPQFEEKLRTHLSNQDSEWLIEQIVRLTVDAHSLEEVDRKHLREEENRRREQRTERVKKLNLGPDGLGDFLNKYKGIKREKLILDGYLKADAPPQGIDMIAEDFR